MPDFGGGYAMNPAEARRKAATSKVDPDKKLLNLDPTTNEAIDDIYDGAQRFNDAGNSDELHAGADQAAKGRNNLRESNPDLTELGTEKAQELRLKQRSKAWVRNQTGKKGSK